MKLKYLVTAAAFALAITAGPSFADVEAAKKWIDAEFQPSTLSKDDQLKEMEGCACPGVGSCAGMFTANSMNCLSEVLGLALP